jgi:hypothetical protein
MLVSKKRRDRIDIMKKVTFTPLFDIGQKVFRRCDSDTNAYFVIQFMIDKKDILYKISGIDGCIVCYDFEISDYSARFAKLN